jgi:malate synthase
MHANVLETSSHRQKSTTARGQVVLNHTVSFLDSTIPLKGASHADVVRYSVETIWRKAECVATLADGRRAKLSDAWQFIGYTGHDPVRCLLFSNNGQHIEVRVDTEQLTIAVEANDTGYVLRNWLGLIKSTLVAMFVTDGSSLVKVLDRGRTYTAVDGSQFSPASCSS